MTSRDHAKRNAVLRWLPESDLDQLLPSLDIVELGRGGVLYEPDEVAPAVWFPVVGVVSLVHRLDHDEIMEVATVGREGMVGLSLFLGGSVPTERAFVQISGEGLRMSAADLQRALVQPDGPLQDALRRYTQALFTQLARNAACNNAHPVHQRAARWLLMTADRMDQPTFDLTQDFLAQMLGARRATVSETAQSLADDGCIRYTRGSITIVDRNALHARACGCYDVITQAGQDALGAK